MSLFRSLYSCRDPKETLMSKLVGMCVSSVNLCSNLHILPFSLLHEFCDMNSLSTPHRLSPPPPPPPLSSSLFHSKLHHLLLHPLLLIRLQHKLPSPVISVSSPPLRLFPSPNFPHLDSHLSSNAFLVKPAACWEPNLCLPVAAAASAATHSHTAK